MAYRERVIDVELRARLARAGAVLIEGPKACGKTASAGQVCLSEVRLDTDQFARQAMDVDPRLVLDGATPRLLDEWQLYPALWDHVRRAVDDRGSNGQFVLTGSARPNDDTRRHSGAGRISRMRMRTMSLWESGHSSGEVSLGALLSGEVPRSRIAELDAAALAELVVRGGWPGQLAADTAAAAASVRDYLELVADVDISDVSGVRRDPERVRRLLRSLGRNTGTEASVTALAKDASGPDGMLTRDTVIDYLAALTRLMVVEDLPAWSVSLRSSATLRKAPKRHFVDPSLAVAALGASPAALVRDLELLGFLFESLAVRDLRIYAQAHDASVWHLRDSYGREADAVVQLPDGTWAAFEVKLGPGAVDAGAASLLRLAQDIDEKRSGIPLALTVLTGWGFAHRRPDGVNVVPIGTLRP